MKDHKLDLASMDCSRIDVFFSLDQDHSAIDEIDESLDEIPATAVYRRSKSEHLFSFSRMDALDGGSDYRASWWNFGPETFEFETRGDPWAALDAGYDAAESAQLSCTFDSMEGIQPKLSLPAKPFAPGVFSFNQIHGYRIARVEDDRTVWSAVVDWVGPEAGCQVSVWVFDFALDGENQSRKIANRLRSIRNSLMTDDLND